MVFKATHLFPSQTIKKKNGKRRLQKVTTLSTALGLSELIQFHTQLFKKYKSYKTITTTTCPQTAVFCQLLRLNIMKSLCIANVCKVNSLSRDMMEIIPNPPTMTMFDTLGKIHKSKPVSRRIISGLFWAAN